MLDRRRAEDYRAGIVAALLFNANRNKHMRAAKPADFFASLRDGEQLAAAPREQTPEQQVAIFKQLFAGRIVQKNSADTATRQ